MTSRILESTFSFDRLPLVCREICQILQTGDWIFLYGNLGAGKTSLVSQLLCSEENEVSAESPTYTLLNSYAASSQLAHSFSEVHHLDLYRVEHLDELYYLGLDLVISSGSLAIFEWPDRLNSGQWKQFIESSGVPPPQRILHVHIEHIPEQPHLRRYWMEIGQLSEL